MKLFKIPTRKPELYAEKDPEVLMARVRELEETVEKYRTQRIGPFKLTAVLTGDSWPLVVWELKQAANWAEKYGPDFMAGSAGAGSSGFGTGTNHHSFSYTVESGKHPGPGETDSDVLEEVRT